MNCHEYRNGQEKRFRATGLQCCAWHQCCNCWGTLLHIPLACLGFLSLWQGHSCCQEYWPKVEWGQLKNELSSTSWILIVLFALVIFTIICVLPDINLQCHSWNSCPNLIALDQSEFSFHNALFETVAWLLHVHWSSIFRHVGPCDTPVSNDSGSWIWLASLCMISPSSQGVLKQRRLQLFVVEGKNHLITSALFESHNSNAT